MIATNQTLLTNFLVTGSTSLLTGQDHC